MNLGTFDRFLRIALGLLLMFALFPLAGWVHWLSLLGFILLFTASLGWCPAYELLGLSTLPTSGDKPCAGDCAAPKADSRREP